MLLERVNSTRINTRHRKTFISISTFEAIVAKLLVYFNFVLKPTLHDHKMNFTQISSS